MLLVLILAEEYPVPEMPLLKPYALSGKAQGTTFILKYRAIDSLVSLHDVNQLFNQVDRSLSLFDSGSLISQFNRADKEIYCDKYLLAVVKKSLEVCAQSGGAFDITVKPLVDLWGFGPAGKMQMPAREKIRKVLSLAGCSMVFLTGSKLAKKNKKVKIDCNGIAQGYTVDLLAALLESKGIENYMVELGGEIRVLGLNNDGILWSVGIEDPEKNERGDFSLTRIIRPGKGAVTTSGSYRNYFVHAGKQFSHIIDPATGYPVDNGMISATVIAPDAITADALDNVCMVLGPDASIELLQRYPNVEAYLVFKTADGRITDTSTNGFYRYIINNVLCY
jgi:thiamine biosynthesis lipoprotein